MRKSRLWLPNGRLTRVASGTAATLGPLRRPVSPRSRVLLAGRQGHLGTKVCFSTFIANPSSLLRWEIANEMHRNPGSPSIKELLDTLESSSEKWDESLPQEKFLKDKGEKKYFWSSASGLAKFKEVDKHSEEFSSSMGGYESKGGKPKGGATGDSAEEQAKYPVYTELKKKVGEAATVSRCLSDSYLLVVYLDC